MTRPFVERIDALATLDEPAEEIERARKAAGDGDGEMREWLERLDAGDALVVTLRLTATVRDGDSTDDVSVTNRAIWLESRFHPPELEFLVHEVAGKDIDALTRCLQQRGCEVGEDDVERMLIHVELHDEVRRRLRPPEHDRLARSPEALVGETPP